MTATASAMEAEATHIGRIRPTRLAGVFCVLASVCMAFRESAQAYWLTVVRAQP